MTSEHVIAFGGRMHGERDRLHFHFACLGDRNMLLARVDDDNEPWGTFE